MDAGTLGLAMGNTPGVDYLSLAPHMSAAMRVAGINTHRRAAMWCAQIGHESAGLRYMEEIASGAAYEGRGDLGNVHAGDGARFKGRGPIQLTGRSNYRAFTRWMNGNGHSSVDFEAQPEKVSDPKFGFMAASWYWTAARPQLNALADRGDLEGATRAINGGLNGLDDRSRRYGQCMALSLLGKGEVVEEIVLPYLRDQVRQDTYYNCGPASVQTIIRSKNNSLISEAALGRELGTHTGGTDYIGQFPRVLNGHMEGSMYRHVDMPNDPPTRAQKERLWNDLTNSIRGGYGVVANFVVPPSNYPRAVAPSTISPSYGGGTVYHYVALMGFSGSGASRRVWVADSGFYPYGYWMSFDQLATCIPPKGYAYASKPAPKKGEKVDKQQADRIERLLNLILDQIVGPGKDAKGHKFTGWPQLGNKTLVDAVASLREQVSKIGKESK